MIVFIKENSWRAKWTARWLKAPGAAIVFGRTIHLWGASREAFLRSPSWVRHEVAHVHQYRRYGMLLFLCFYLVEGARKGYYNNRFEREARSYERDGKILDGVVFR